MNRPLMDHLRNLGTLLGLGVALAFVGCSDDTDGTGASSTGSTGTGTGTTATSTSGTGTSGSSEGTGGTGGGGGTDGTGGTGGNGTGGAGGSAEGPSLSFFVSSTGSTTGNLGGLAGADKRCQDLATAVGAGSRTWRAYLSVEKGPNGQPEHAKDRIGQGPWYNVKLALVAENLTALHERFGDHTEFLDEKGNMIPGQWPNSPKPNEHDILTGTDRDGNVVPGKTCADWTSAEAGMTAWVGHCDGLGPNVSMEPMYRPWNSVHENGGCDNTAPKGGAGRVYCFAAD